MRSPFQARPRTAPILVAALALAPSLAISVALTARAQDDGEQSPGGVKLAQLRKQIRETSAAGQYKEALTIIQSFRNNNDPRGELKGEIDKVYQYVIDHAHERVKIELKNADEGYAKGTPAAEIISNLETMASQMPDDINPPLHEKAKEIKKRDDEAKARDLLATKFLAARDAALAAAKLDDALKVAADAAKDPALAPIPSEAARFKSDTEELVKAWKTFDATVEKLASDDKRVTRTRDGKELQGPVRGYDAKKWLAEVKISKREVVPLDLYDLEPSELLRFALTRDSAPASELHGAALYFAQRGESGAASLALDKCESSGTKDPALRERVKKLDATANDRHVERVVALVPAMAAISPAWAVQTIKDLAAKNAKHPGFEKGSDALRAAFIAARTTLLGTSDAGRFFHGKCTLTTEGLVKLEYDMKDPAQAEDFTTDETAVKGSTVKLENGKLAVRGKAVHCAVWQGGELNVDLSALSGNPKRPNLNVTLADHGGWKALLVGGGFIYGGLSRLRLVSGEPVNLPANVVIDLAGKEPDEDTNAAYGKDKPKCPEGRVVRLTVTRSPKGALHVTVGGQNAVNMPTSAHWDEDGSIGILPATTELAIDHFEISGKLDPKALADRTREIAEGEANALFGEKKKEGDGK